MIEKLKKIRQQNPQFDKTLVDIFAEKMPKLLLVIIDGYEYDDHIGSKEVAKLAEKFITDDKGQKIGFKWSYEEVLNIAQNFVNIENSDFYPTDLWVWANVKYGDMGHIVVDVPTIIKYSIAELMDDDFPFYDASKRAYYWLKKHIENEEKE